MNAVVLKNVTKKFDNSTIFENLSFNIEEGDIVTVTGDSGKGKTTLLRCLTGLEKIDGGTIEIFGEKLVDNGKYVNGKTQKEILKNVGMVFQNYNLFPNLSGRKNLEIICDDSEKIDGLLSEFGLYGKKDLYPQNLSGGQKQRVAIIRTLLKKPKIILFDEPTSALDDKNRNIIINLINELQEDNYTVIIVTHDFKLIESLDSRIFNLNT